jgi:hypothetical protein
VFDFARRRATRVFLDPSTGEVMSAAARTRPRL